MRQSMDVVLISTYELGRQPLGIAAPAAWLAGTGARVTCLDLAVDPLDPEPIRRAHLIAFHLPMHTATRLALASLERVRSLNPRADLCAYGLYAAPHEEHLRSLGVGTVLGGEFEAGLRSLVERLHAGDRGPQREPVVSLARLRPPVPERSGLPPLARYARLVLPGGDRRLTGSLETTRGCRHRCRHCPVVPVYQGAFRVVPAEVVLEDARRQVEAGARHFTFGDPDFWNGPGHGMRIAEGLHREFPDLTYDVTIKVEHLLRHQRLLPDLRRTGCLFVTTAVESCDDTVLERLDKGHTREDFERALGLLRGVGLHVAPTFIPFTPWTSPAGFLELLGWITGLDLISHVPAVQLGLRLLIPPGSRLLELPEIRDMVGPFDPTTLVHPWSHRDPQVDRLQRQVARLAEQHEAADGSRGAAFTAIWGAACSVAGTHRPAPPVGPGPPAPYISEGWFCCAEPTRAQLGGLEAAPRPRSRGGVEVQ